MRFLLLLIAAVVCAGCTEKAKTPDASSPSTTGGESDSVGEASTADPQTPGDLDPQQQLEKLVQSPTRDTYLALHKQLIASSSYQPYSNEIDTAMHLMDQERFGEALTTLEDAKVNLMLSPGAHLLLATLHTELGDEQAAQSEREIYQACLEAILATGDGSQQSPYLVLRTSDEYDLALHLGKQVNQQSLIHEGDKHLDLVECADGTEIWFDITAAFDHLSKAFQQ